jgi:hypothetical protein
VREDDSALQPPTPPPPLYPQCNQSISALMLAYLYTARVHMCSALHSHANTERKPRKSDTGAFLASTSGFSSVLNARRGQNAFGTSFLHTAIACARRLGTAAAHVAIRLHMRRWCGVAEQNKKSSSHIAKAA